MFVLNCFSHTMVNYRKALKELEQQNESREYSERVGCKLIFYCHLLGPTAAICPPPALLLSRGPRQPALPGPTSDLPLFLPDTPVSCGHENPARNPSQHCLLSACQRLPLGNWTLCSVVLSTEGLPSTVVTQSCDREADLVWSLWVLPERHN